MPRFYLPSTGAAPISPAFNTSWDESASADRLKAVTTRINSAMASKTVAKGTGATRALVRQYIYGPIAAQTINGSAPLKGQVRCLESAANDNLDLVPSCIRVVSGDGNTYRTPALLALGDYAAALEFGTALTNRKIADGDLSTEVVASQGDYLIIEIGEKNSATGSSVSGSFSFGDDSATDLPEDVTTTAANNPWLDIPNEIAPVGDTTLGPWCDNFNAQQAPMKALTRITQTTGGSGKVVGQNTNQEAYGERFTATADGKLLRVRFFPSKVGSPTDSLIVKLYANSSGLPGTLLNTSLPVPSSIVAGTTSQAQFEFATPTTLVNGTVYHAICWRTGSLDVSNYYSIDGVLSDAYANGSGMSRTFGIWEVDNLSYDRRFDIEIESSNWYKFEIDRDNAKLQCFRSTDNGANWSEQDGANAPSIANALGRFGCAVQRKGANFYVLIPTSIEEVKRTFPFDSSANTWGSATTRTFGAGSYDTPKQYGVNVAGVGPIFHNYREYSTVIASQKDFTCLQGVAELISGVRYRRILTQQGTAEGYLTGSGVSVHYDLRSHVSDWRDWTYFFYTKSDSTQIQVATVGVDSVTPTVVGGLSASAVDQTTKYPLGQGCHFWRDGVNYIAVPYVDGSNIKVLYCESGTPANTAANWLSSTAAAATAESNTSNPGFLVADNEQGGKLFLFFVDDTTGDLMFVHDDGSFTWSEPQVFYSSGDVAGCAGTLSDGAIGMLLRDSSTFELIFKTFDVFFLKSDWAIGTYESERDFLQSGQVNYRIIIDVDELAGTTYQADVYTREDVTDDWQLMGGMGAIAADTNGIFSFVRSRYVKIITTVTGGEFPSGIFGFEF